MPMAEHLWRCLLHITSDDRVYIHIFILHNVTSFSWTSFSRMQFSHFIFPTMSFSLLINSQIGFFLSSIKQGLSSGLTLQGLFTRQAWKSGPASILEKICLGAMDFGKIIFGKTVVGKAHLGEPHSEKTRSFSLHLWISCNWLIHFWNHFESNIIWLVMVETWEVKGTNLEIKI